MTDYTIYMPHAYWEDGKVVSCKGCEQCIRDPKKRVSPKLSKEAREAWKPRPPHELVDALQDQVIPHSGKLIKAEQIKEPCF